MVMKMAKNMKNFNNQKLLYNPVHRWEYFWIFTLLYFSSCSDEANFLFAIIFVILKFFIVKKMYLKMTKNHKGVQN